MNTVTYAQPASSGLGFFGLLTIVFIVLKLLGHIDWSWWWVLSPLWLPFVALLVIAAVCAALVLVFDGPTR